MQDPPTLQIRAGNPPCNASSDRTEQHRTAQQAKHQPSYFSTIDSTSHAYPMPKQKPNCININKLKKMTKHKEIAKEKADKKSYVKSSNLQVGDRVLCRQQRKDKITPPFNPKPYVVTTIKSSQVIAENDTRVIKRHITHFKKLRGTSGRQTIDITESRILK